MKRAIATLITMASTFVLVSVSDMLIGKGFADAKFASLSSGIIYLAVRVGGLERKSDKT